MFFPERSPGASSANSAVFLRRRCVGSQAASGSAAACLPVQYPSRAASARNLASAASRPLDPGTVGGSARTPKSLTVLKGQPRGLGTHRSPAGTWSQRSDPSQASRR